MGVGFFIYLMKKCKPKKKASPLISQAEVVYSTDTNNLQLVKMVCNGNLSDLRTLEIDKVFFDQFCTKYIEPRLHTILEQIYTSLRQLQLYHCDLWNKFYKSMGSYYQIPYEHLLR